MSTKKVPTVKEFSNLTINNLIFKRISRQNYFVIDGKVVGSSSNVVKFKKSVIENVVIDKLVGKKIVFKDTDIEEFFVISKSLLISNIVSKNEDSMFQINSGNIYIKGYFINEIKMPDPSVHLLNLTPCSAKSRFEISFGKNHDLKMLSKNYFIKHVKIETEKDKKEYDNLNQGFILEVKNQTTCLKFF